MLKERIEVINIRFIENTNLVRRYSYWFTEFLVENPKFMVVMDIRNVRVVYVT